MNAVIQEVAPQLGGVSRACNLLGVPRASYYRSLTPPKDGGTVTERPKPKNALSTEERELALEYLHSERFVDKPPAAVVYSLLDEGIYIASERTLYRILADNKEVKDRRAQRRHVNYTKPELIATAPNQVWTWDISKLKGPVAWTYYYLYVIIDIFSRKVVGWMLAEREAGSLAEQLIEETCIKENIKPGQLTIHSDRGPAMQSGPVVHLHARLGITKSNSRPYVSDDNPFSEAQFKTLKYHPGFPERFGGYEDALAFCKPFFQWYNNDHYHSGIQFLTPAMVHHGQSDAVLMQRHQRLLEAYNKTPERFITGPPAIKTLERAVYINPPQKGDKNSLN